MIIASPLAGKCISFNCNANICKLTKPNVLFAERFCLRTGRVCEYSGLSRNQLIGSRSSYSSASSNDEETYHRAENEHGGDGDAAMSSDEDSLFDEDSEPMQVEQVEEIDEIDEETYQTEN